ncbi:hypothetical protein K1719_015529 [Acacia pycnantha]|nr:hypothetical protein K1719_015529 [Acacia pycnantha]
MEQSLDDMYRQGRVEYKSIGPLEIRVVKNGTFEELMDYAISRGASISQYKAPRFVCSTPILELLDSRVVSVHFSPSAPHWTTREVAVWIDAMTRLGGLMMITCRPFISGGNTGYR